MANRGDNTEQRKSGDNKCFVCKSICNNTCSRCGEFYCSIQCQTTDWRQHKYFCFRMPPLTSNPLSSNGNGQHDNNNSVSRGNNPRSRFEQKSSLNRNGHMNSYEKTGETARSANSPNTSMTSMASTTSTNHSNPKPVFEFVDAPKNNDDVFLTFVRFANSFFIRPCIYDDEYMKNVEDFDRHGRIGLKLISLPQRDDLVLVNFDGKYRRAIVLQVESAAKIEVAVVDTGRKVSKPLHEMREISEELKSRKRSNFSLTLNNLPARIDQKPFTKLLNSVSNKTVFTLQYDGNWSSSPKNCKLLEKCTGLSIELFATEGITKRAVEAVVEPQHEQLDESQSAEVSEAEQHPQAQPALRNTSDPTPRRKVSIGDLPTTTLPEVADLYITDNSLIKHGYVTAILQTHQAELVAILAKAEEFGNADDEVYMPESGELCLVKWENEWYRAINYEPKFCFIDFGFFEYIEDRNIRRFPNEFLEPCHAITCSINGFESQMIEELEKTLAPYSVHPHCICAEAGEDSYNVTFPKVEQFRK